MNKKEKQKYAKELKSVFKDIEEYTDKKGKDRIRFNVGPVEVHDLIKNQVLRVVPKDGKNYMTLNLDLGMNDKIKKERKENRIKLVLIKQKTKSKIYTKIKENKAKIRKRIYLNEIDGVEDLIESNKNLMEEIKSLSSRK